MTDASASQGVEPPVGDTPPRSTFIVPLLIAAYTVAYIVQVRNLPFSATLYPYLLATAIALGLVFIVISQRRESRRALLGSIEALPVTKKSQLAILPALFVIACAFYPVLVVRVGFALTTTAFVLLMLRAFGEKNWLHAVLIAVGTTLGFVVAVDWLLGIPLPRFSLATLPYGI